MFCLIKDWNSYFKLSMDNENISYFNVCETGMIAHVFHRPEQA